MNNTEARVLATFFVWTAFTIVGVTAITNGGNIGDFMGLVLAVILTGAAVTATQSIWKNANAVASSTEKSKRRNNVDRVLDRLSDQEIEDLRARLIGEADGEVSSLDELIRR